MENKRKILRDSNIKVDESVSLQDKPATNTKLADLSLPNKPGPIIKKTDKTNTILGDKSSMPQNQNNIAKMLFGTKQRSQSIKKERNSIDKNSFEQALNSSMKEGAKSEERKPRGAPKVTIINRNSPSNPKANTSSLAAGNKTHNSYLNDSLNQSRSAKPKMNVTIVDAPSESIINEEVKSQKNGVVAIPGLARTGDGMLTTQKKMTRTRIVNRVDHLLNKALVPIPKGNDYNDGPSLRDNRRGKLLDNQKEANKSWEEFFGSHKTEVRWDLFEDFLYLTSEMFLGKHLSVIKDTNWDEYFFSFFRILGRACSSSQNFKEVPEIPFASNDLVYKGRTVSKQDWVAHVENNGIEITLKNMADKLILTDRLKESTVVKSSLTFIRKALQENLRDR